MTMACNASHLIGSCGIRCALENLLGRTFHPVERQTPHKFSLLSLLLWRGFLFRDDKEDPIVEETFEASLEEPADFAWWHQVKRRSET